MKVIFNRAFLIIFILAISANFSYANSIEEEYKHVMAVFNKDQYPEARKLAEQLLEQTKTEQDFYHLTKLYFLLGYICEYTEDFGKSIIYYLEGSRHGQLAGDERLKKTIISIHKNLASVLSDYKHYDLAYKFIDEGILLAEEVQNESQVISLLNNKIFVLLEEERFEEAITGIHDLRKNHNISKERDLIIENKLGWALQSLDRLDEALVSYQKVVKDTLSIGLAVHSISLQNMALIHSNRQQYELAVERLNASITHCKTYDFPRWLLRSYGNFGELYLDLHKPKTAIKFLKEGVSLLENEDQLPQSYEIYKLLSSAYYELGNLHEALKYKERYSVELEQYIEQQNKITEDEQKYNIQLLTDRYFDLLAADKDQKNTERMAKFGISGTALVFLSILLAMLYKQRRTRVSLARELSLIEAESDV